MQNQDSNKVIVVQKGYQNYIEGLLDNIEIFYFIIIV
jgi:hypothetical protein